MPNYELTAADIMQTEVATILADASVQEAATLMRYEGVRSLLVILPETAQGFGIITFSDIVKKVIAKRLDPRQVTVEQVAIAKAQTILENTDVQTIARIFGEDGYGHAPVINAQGKLVGIVSMTDLITEVITEPD